MADGDKAWRQWRFRARGGRTAPAPEVPAAAPALSSGDRETSQVIYDRMMKDVVRPALRELGFTGSSGRFELKKDGETWRLLGFQKSAYSDRDEVRFTLNLSTISKAVWEEQSASRVLPAKPSSSTYYGAWTRQTRITDLLPDKEAGEKWWRVMPGQDMDALSADLLGNIRDYAVPWLERDA